MSPEHREYAELMLRRARDDLQSAQTLIASGTYAENVVGFLLQQSVEKALKAVVAASESEIPHTHDLEKLARLVGDLVVGLPAVLLSIDWLTPWAVDFRYEEFEETLAVDRATEAAIAAVGLAEQILDEDDTDPA